MSPERENLRHAINAHARAQEQARQAQATLEKATDLLAGLQAELEGLASLDADLAAARVTSLKIALQADERPRFEDPEGFAVARLKAAQLETQIAQAREAVAVLEDELAQAQRLVVDCDVARELAAEKVLCSETEELATAHLEKLEALRKEHYLLGFLAMRQVKRAPNEPGLVATVPGYLYGSGPTRKVAMPGVVVGAAMEPILGSYERAGGLRVRDAIAVAVTAYWAALKTDPEATLDFSASASPLSPPLAFQREDAAL